MDGSSLGRAGVRLGSRCEELKLSESRPPCLNKRTSSRRAASSVKGHQAASFDNLIGADEQHRGQCEPERLRSLEIDTQLEFGRSVEGDISGTAAFKNLVDEAGEAPKGLW